MRRSYYQVLGVPRDAPTEEIERAFKAEARRVHPDLHGGDGAAEERMKQLNVIRDTLTDPSRRAAYDAGPGAGAGAASPPRRPPPPRETWTPERGAAWMNTSTVPRPPTAAPRAAPWTAPPATAAPPPARRWRGRPWRVLREALLTHVPWRARPTLGAAVDLGFRILTILFVVVLLRMVLMISGALSPRH